MFFSTSEFSNRLEKTKNSMIRNNMEILIVIIVGALVYFIAKALMPNKYRCNHCQSPNNHIKDAKSEDFSHTKFTCIKFTI